MLLDVCCHSKVLYNVSSLDGRARDGVITTYHVNVHVAKEFRDPIILDSVLDQQKLHTQTLTPVGNRGLLW